MHTNQHFLIQCTLIIFTFFFLTLVQAGPGELTTDKSSLKPLQNKIRPVLKPNKQPVTKNNNSAIGNTATQAGKFNISGTKLSIVEHSKEFFKLSQQVNVTERQWMTFQWQTNQSTAKNGKWEVRNLSNGNQFIATGYTQTAPAIGKHAQFKIHPYTFLYNQPPAADTVFSITVQPVDNNYQPVGNPSPAVKVTQISQSNIPAITKFKDSEAVFPAVDIESYKEKVGMVKLTQIYYTGADIKLRITNKGSKRTDPVLLKLTDFNVLLQQKSAPIQVPALLPKTSIKVDVHMDAVLPPPASQTGQRLQQKTWLQWKKDRCGPILRAIMDWQGDQNNAPMISHKEVPVTYVGWSDYAKFENNRRICADGNCINMCSMEKYLHNALHNHTVGYAFFIGNTPRFIAGGNAQLLANNQTVPFRTDTKIMVASVTKFITAITAIRILADNNIRIDDKIAPYFPSDWKVGDYFKNLTFAQLLSQTSGIKEYGKTDEITYAGLKKFFEKNYKAGAMACSGQTVIAPYDPYRTPRCSYNYIYSNFNTAIMRILLPKVAGFAEDSNTSSRHKTLADQYVQLVQQHVFTPVGILNVKCKPPASGDHAIAYKLPIETGGFNTGDHTLYCGAIGLYLSVEDLSKVMLSINNRDGKILRETDKFSELRLIRKRNLGVDTNNKAKLEKNGGMPYECEDEENKKKCGGISTTVSIFGPGEGPNFVAILLLNSNIKGGPGNWLSARDMIQKAYDQNFTPAK